jgi:hypothetical protein
LEYSWKSQSDFSVFGEQCTTGVTTQTKNATRTTAVGAFQLMLAGTVPKDLSDF